MLANYFFFCSLFFLLGIIFNYYFSHFWFYFAFLALFFFKKLTLVFLLLLSFFFGGLYLNFFNELQKDNWITIIRELPPSEKRKKYLVSFNGQNYFFYYPFYEESLYPYDKILIEGRFLENKIFPEKIKSKKVSPFRKIYLFKEKINNTIKENYSFYTSEIIKGILYGEEIVDKELRSNFQKSGLSHLTAMSGYNLVILSALWLRLSSFLPVNFLYKNLISLFLIIIFVIFANFQSSVIRAALMVGVLILAKIIGRPPLTRNLIIFTALIISLFNPKALLEDIGFQLSFLATMGIIYLANIFEKIFKSKMLSEIMAAQCAVMPLILYKFGNFNPFAIISNLIILPTVPFLMILGLLAIIFYAFYPFNQLINIPFEVFAQIISLFSTFPQFYLSLPWWFIFSIYLIMLYYIYQNQKNEKIDFNFSY